MSLHLVRHFVVAAILLPLIGPLAAAENWPGWRGPRGDGSSAEQHVPIRWDASNDDNIHWRYDIPGVGVASPIVWGERVYLTACVPDQQQRVLICLDRRTGEERWKRVVFRAPLETLHTLNSYASGTPATDGESVFVSFLKVDGRLVPAPNVGTPRDITPGEIVVAAYRADGQLQWQVSPGSFICAHGFASCPVLFEDLVILNGDHDGDSYVVGLDKATGTERWRLPRRHKMRSYVTPLIREVGGRKQMFFSGSKCIVSVDPRSGERIWNIEGPTEQFVASMVYDGSLLFMACGFPDHFVMGIRPDGRGDVTESHVAWQTRLARCYVPSPVVVDNYLMVADDRGTANCFDTATGKRYWQARLGKGFNASLVHANGLVYLTATDGQTKVIRPGETLEVVAENKLGQPVSASPAISQGQIFMRGEDTLFCIGKLP